MIHFEGFPRDAITFFEDIAHFNEIVAVSPGIPLDVITSPALVDLCGDHAKAILPLHQWLVGIQGS